MTYFLTIIFINVQQYHIMTKLQSMKRKNLLHIIYMMVIFTHNNSNYVKEQQFFTSVNCSINIIMEQS